jgi:hypothetical protein
VTAIVLIIAFGGSTWSMRRYFNRAPKKLDDPAIASDRAAIGPPRAPKTEPANTEDI